MPRVIVRGVPKWVPHERLLGPGLWAQDDTGAWVMECERSVAADVQARLRGLGMDGAALEVFVTPRLKRPQVREARTIDARRRRTTSPGFTMSGTRLDDEGRYSLTPEALAMAIGRRAKGLRVVDATCGAGGNAIGFARAGCSVIAIDNDAARLGTARHNAAIYGVGDRIRFVHGDAAAHVIELDADLCFVDPPWNAPDPLQSRLTSIPVLEHLLPFTQRFPRCWLKLPPSFVTQDLADFTPSAWFGVAEGDRERVKFLLLTRDQRP